MNTISVLYLVVKIKDRKSAIAMRYGGGLDNSEILFHPIYLKQSIDSFANIHIGQGDSYFVD